MAAVFVANAVPAKRGFRNFTQPDGSVIEVQLVGDESGHYYLSKDNKPMISDAEGYLRYATVGANGAITTVASEAAAADLSDFTRAFKARRNETRKIRRNAPSRVAAQNGLGLFTGNYPRTGKVRCLVFLVEYSDVKFTTPNPEQYFKDLFNKEGFSEYKGTGSVRDYFLDQSNGKFDPTFDVYGPVTLKNKRSYYGGNDRYGDDQHPEEMAAEAAAQLQNQIDFSQYDLDNDGYVDNVFVVYAGMGEASGGPEESVWPHAWNIPEKNAPIYNGKTLSGYCCVNEWEYDNTPAPIGTFVHEFSHVMGLPDLYHTDDPYQTAYYTPDSYSVLDYGPYNNNGRTPPAYSAFERNAMGWLDPIVLDGPESVALEEIQKSNTCYLIPTEKTTEFFLLENRQLTGWDEYIPWHGMLIWHVDFVQSVWDNNEVNNTQNHQYVDIVEASGAPSSFDKTGYPFPGGKNVTSFTSTTNPALKSWAGKAIDLPITEIAETNGVIYFNVAGGNFDLETPAAPVLVAAEDGTITATWEAVPHATGYRFNLYTRSGDTKVPFAEYSDFNTGNVTKLVISGVEGTTEYFATIAATVGSRVSETSEEASVTTPEVAFKYLRPTAISAKRALDGTITFEWAPVKNAVDYRLTVQVETDGGEATISNDFGDSDYAVIVPQGWTWTGAVTDLYKSTSTGYFGESAPALKFGADGRTLTTPLFDGAVKELSFFLAGAGVDNVGYFSVNGGRMDSHRENHQPQAVRQER